VKLVEYPPAGGPRLGSRVRVSFLAHSKTRQIFLVGFFMDGRFWVKLVEYPPAGGPRLGSRVRVSFLAHSKTRPIFLVGFFMDGRFW